MMPDAYISTPSSIDFGACGRKMEVAEYAKRPDFIHGIRDTAGPCAADFSGSEILQRALTGE